MHREENGARKIPKEIDYREYYYQLLSPEQNHETPIDDLVKNVTIVRASLITIASFALIGALILLVRVATN